MANNIKGLTVEIGGDTTKLDKALQSVNKNTSSLSKELGEINRLLKFDPENADLLAQKQKVLASAVEETKSKLDILKEAEKQVQEQFERGEVSEEQYRALQREIIATTGKLESYERAAQQTADEIEKLGRSSDEAADDLDDAGDNAEDAADSVDELDDAADKAEKSTGKLGDTLRSGLKAGLTAVVTGATAVIGALGATAESTRELRTGLAKVDTAFETNGFSVKQGRDLYNELYAVLGDSDRVVETEGNLSKLCTTQQDLNKWVDISTGVYAQFGDGLPIEGLAEAANETAKVAKITGPLADAINWSTTSTEEWNKALSGNSKALAAFQKGTEEGMSAEDAFNEALAACSTEQERQSLITDTLTYLYKDQAAAYRENASSILDANRAQAELEQSLAAVGGAVEPVMSSFKMLGASFLSDLVPAIEELGGGFTDLFNGVDGASEKIGGALSNVLTTALNKITELLPQVATIATSLVTTIVTSIVTELPQLLETGVKVVTTILNGITSSIPQLTTALVNMIPELASALVSGIPQLLDAGVQLLMAIVNAIPQILPVLVAALPQIVTSIVTSLVSQVPSLLQGAITLLLAIVDAIPILIQQLIPQISTIVASIVSALIEAIPTLLAGAIELFMALVQAIPQIQLELAKILPNVIAGIVQGIIDGIPKLIAAALEAGKALLDRIKSFFGIHSPSTVMADVGKNLVAGIVNGIKDLPAKVAVFFSKVLSNIGTWASNLASKGRTAAKNLFDAIINGIKDLPSKVTSIGSNLVRGLWNGISNMTSWVISKIRGFSDNVLSGIKKFFGVHSPSTKTSWIGQMLDEGLAEGIFKNADAPLDAMDDLGSDLLDSAGKLNGATIDRQLNTTFSGTMSAESNKLDVLVALVADYMPKLVDAAKKAIVLDSGVLVGETIDDIDRSLSYRYGLKARGV